MKSTVLVTGGAGFMGAHLAEELIKLGYKTVVLDDLSGGFEENVPNKAVFVKGSILNFKLIRELFKKYKFDYVFHLGAYAAEGLSHFIRIFNYRNNLLGSINLINESIRYNVKCFVFTSSIAVYGTNQLPMKEETTPQPEDPYGISKYAVELDLKSAYEMFGLNYIIFRPHNVYGEKQNLGDKYRNVVGIFMNQIMQNKPLTIFGEGKQTRAFSYIGDVAPIIAKSIKIKKAYNQVFNIGADKPYTVNYLAETVKKAMSSNQKTKHLPARNEVVHAYSSHNKVKKVLGYKTKFSLEEGVQRMADWAKKIGSKKSKKFKNIELTKNLPPSWVEK
ncbi:MAG: NAD-dependent epimerase/dehydratase family protein [Nanoarchaeota archaeon]|nr:NAD-dependent epimerase/dehydratase family protein [DPANN group archaeon]MBL7116668.1 NAD-dependent epimerase/dehydratase family protein [Nanoarchaeota archaeon]